VSPAIALLAEARNGGFSVRLADGKVKVGGRAPPALLDRMRQHKADIADLLSGGRCRHCGEPVTAEHYQHPGGSQALPFADGSAAHLSCDDQVYVHRILAAAARAVAPGLDRDEAEITLRGELP
jgi:hypothetical protein